MWQRKQTLFLAIAILINSSLFFIDLAIVKCGEYTGSFGMYGVDALQEGSKSYMTMVLAIILSVSMTLSLVSMVSFKKRQMQIKMSQLNLLVQIGFVMALFFISESAMDVVKVEGPAPVLDYSLGAYVTVFPLFFIYLAIRFIKKDEALVRAADRIR